MIRRVLITSVLLALTMPAAHGAGSMNYGNTSYAVPDDMGLLSLYRDCTPSSTMTDDMPFCHYLQMREYADPLYNMSVSIFPVKHYSAIQEEELETVYQQANMDNFQALLKGDVTLDDFYDENGILLNDDNRILDILPMGFPPRMVRDVEPIEANGKLVGYAYTPAVSGGDFPPYFSFRIANIYDEEHDMFIVLSDRISFQDNWYQSVNEYLMEHGPTVDGDIDYQYYYTRETELYNLLFEHFSEHGLPLLAEYHRVDRLAKELMETPARRAFNDVPNTYPFLEAVEYVKARGYVQGYADGTYKPDAPINRAEFLKILVEANIGDDISTANIPGCFSDVVTGAWYTNYVCYAKNMGIIEGYPDGSFGPARNINIAEALKIIIEAYGLPKPVYVREPDNWYDPYLNTADSHNMRIRLIKGPSELVTRGDMAELIMRLESHLESINE